MSPEKLKPPRGATRKAASNQNSNLNCASVASRVKRAIVFTALAGYLPMNLATWLLSRLRLEAA